MLFLNKYLPSNLIVKFVFQFFEIGKIRQSTKKGSFSEKKTFSSFYKASSTKLEGEKHASGSRPVSISIQKEIQRKTLMSSS